jgi:predicted Zn-dependent protease
LLFAVNRLAPSGAGLLLALLAALLPTAAWSHAGDERGLAQLQQLIKQQPRQQQHYIKRGALYTRAAHYHAALADFARAQTLGPPAAVGYELGVYYYRRQQLASAAEQLYRFLGHYGKVPAALEYRLKVARALGQKQRASELFEALVQDSPYANPSHYLAAARADLDTDTGVDSETESQLVQALGLIDRGIERFGPVPQLQHYAIELELRQRHYQQAIDRHRTLATATGRSPHWQARQAQLLAAAGQEQRALVLARRAQQALATQTQTPARARLAAELSALAASID